MNTEKVSFDQAEKEMTEWLDNKRVPERKRNGHCQDAIETLTGAIVDGDVSIEGGKIIVQHLRFPVTDKDGNTVQFSELRYAQRITYAALKGATQNVKIGDGTGRLMAFASALTGVNISLLERMDTEDLSILQAVAVFFL